MNITGVTPNPLPITTPVYPVSSINSLNAHSSAVSPSSINPAGTSMVTASMGGRNCFCRRMEGGLPSLDSTMAAMPTPSMVVFLGRVRRWEDSQVRVVPLAAV